MPTGNIAKQAGPTLYPAAHAAIPVVTWTAGTVTGDGGDLIDVSGGNVLVLVRNTDDTNPYTFTVTGVANSKGRTIAITKTLTAGQVAAFGPVPGPGWSTSAGKLTVSVEHADVEWAVLDLNR